MKDWTRPENWHPAASIFPLMDEAELDALAKNIGEHGLREPLMIYDGTVLDGRNRALACGRINVEPATIPFTGTDPLAWVLSQNLDRRHLNESDRAMVAARLANMRQGERTDLEPSANLQKVSRAEAAKRCTVSERSVAYASDVLKQGVPDLINAVGKLLPVSQAAAIAKRPEEIQRRVVAMLHEAHRRIVEKLPEAGTITKAWRQVRKEISQTLPHVDPSTPAVPLPPPIAEQPEEVQRRVIEPRDGTITKPRRQVQREERPAKAALQVDDPSAERQSTTTTPTDIFDVEWLAALLYNLVEVVPNEADDEAAWSRVAWARSSAGWAAWRALAERRRGTQKRYRDMVTILLQEITAQLETGTVNGSMIRSTPDRRCPTRGDPASGTQ